MCKFRTWLIKKLGGYTIEPPKMTYNIIHHETHPIKLKAKLILSRSDINLIGAEKVYEFVQSELIRKLGEGILANEQDLISYSQTEEENNFIFTASIYAFKEPA